MITTSNRTYNKSEVNDQHEVNFVDNLWRNRMAEIVFPVADERI